jgi:hypothetical protein
MRQRGILRQSIALLLDHSDIALNAGDDCETWRLSRNAARELRAEGMSPELIARARQLALVVADGVRVTTILHIERGRRGRCYRRQLAVRAAV